MSNSSKPEWLQGVAVYQDVVLDGQTAYAGSRDCQGAWEAIAPHLTPCGTVLDVGSNFGWFGLQVCKAAPDCVVASVEADELSATVQRRVLQSNSSERICLLTCRAGVTMARRFAAAGQRFDAVLCLAVLHWMADHRKFLSTLGPISRRLFIEQPDPAETGAGVERIRRAIGPIGPYLQNLFPDRPVRFLARLRSPREGGFARELWLVDEPTGWPAAPVQSLDLAALLHMSPSWPPRSWWEGQLRACAATLGPAGPMPPRIVLAPGGLQTDGHQAGTRSIAQLQRLVRRIPEDRLLRPMQQWYRRSRRLAGRVLRGRLLR